MATNDDGRGVVKIDVHKKYKLVGPVLSQDQIDKIVAQYKKIKKPA